MKTLRQLIPEARSVSEMQPADLAGYVLEVLMSAGPTHANIWHLRNFVLTFGREYALPGQSTDAGVGIACSSAWSWLEVNGLICQDPEQSVPGFYRPTRIGQLVRDRQQLHEVMTSDRLPEEFLHSELLSNVRPLFFQSRFETAVFEAFKTLEVAIRTAAGLGHDLLGVQLANRAFNPENGPLTDMDVERGERVALMNLVAGALGSYKNPASHRRVEIAAEEARDMIILASHLLKIVESRSRPGP